MTKYKVYWYSDLPGHKFLEKQTPEEAYDSFLQDSPSVKNESVCVSSDDDFFSFDDHMEKLKPSSLESSRKPYAPLTHRKGSSTSSSGWRVLTIEGHKYALRQNTAYSHLRMYLTITAWVTATGFAILGLVLLNGNSELAGLTLLIAGPLFAALQYFIASVYFDIADAGLNASMRIQDLHRMESAKEVTSETEEK